MGFIDRILGNTQIISESFVPDTEDRAVIIPSREEIVVNETSALSLVAVSRAISVLETAIMQIPVDVHRDITKIETPLWLETPDLTNNVSQAEFIGQTVVSMAMTGNAYWRVTRGTRGVNNLKVLDPSKVTVSEDDNANIYFSINGKKYLSNDIVHLKLWQRPGEKYGEGPLQRHKSLIRSALDLHNYSDNWFKTSAVPTGTLTTTEFLSEDVAKSNKDAFIKSQRERSVAVLSSGLKYDSVALNPEQAQFLENQKQMNRQIALAFGVPSLYLGLGIEGQGMTYVNGNEDRNKLYEDGLQQYIIRIQQALTDLLPRGQRAEFNLTEFLRPNQLVRYQAYAIGLDKAFLTVPEIRNLEGMSPMDGTATTPNQPVN